MQSDGVNKLRRFEFVFKGNSYKFVLNPEEYNVQEPNRITVTQTKGGAFVDDFGGGIPNILMRGTTGFKNGTKSGTHGFRKFRELRNMIRDTYFDTPPGTRITGANELVFHNHTDGEHYVVVPRTFDLFRSIARPHLYQYDIQLIAIQSASTAARTNAPAINARLRRFM